MIMANDNNKIQATTDDSQIVLYQPDDSIRLEVKLDQDTLTYQEPGRRNRRNRRIYRRNKEAGGAVLLQAHLPRRGKRSRLLS